MKTRTIKLASPELIVFLHELAHAVDDHLHGIQGGQIPLQEVVAEFSAAVIAYLTDYKIPLGNVKKYIESYILQSYLKHLRELRELSALLSREQPKPACQVSLLVRNELIIILLTLNFI